LAAHFSTVATFVPTDVDTAIRYKLWLKVHHDLGFTPLWNLVKEFQKKCTREKRIERNILKNKK
jgi:hypothetical protein